MALKLLELVRLSPLIIPTLLHTHRPQSLAVYDNADQSAYYRDLCLYFEGFTSDPSFGWFQSNYVNLSSLSK